jgi:hypothetical protein
MVVFLETHWIICGISTTFSSFVKRAIWAPIMCG